MKRLYILLTVAALVVGTARSQTPLYAPQTLTGVATCAASAATNLNAVIDCRKQSTVGLQITSTNTLNSGANDGAITLYYSRSVDNVNYETNLNAVAWTPKGLNAAVIVTNLSSYGAGYLKVHYVTNAAGGSTNVGYLNLVYGIKLSAP